MSQQIHGHEVMEMMANSGLSYTKESLQEAIGEKFGNDARFFTCSAENMTPVELIVFLEGCGRFFVNKNGLSTDHSKICSHEGIHDH